MHVKTLAEKKDLDNKEMLYSIHFKEKKVQHDDAKEVPSKHQNQENNQDQLKKILMTKKIVKNQTLRKDVLAFLLKKD